MSEWVFVRYPLTAVGCRGYFAIGVYLSPIATACGEYNYPAPPAQVCRLGLPFKQSSFIPHSQRFTLPFSSGSIVSQLTTLPICYTPHWVSPPDKSVGDRVICTSLRNTFSYCRATGRIPNCPRAALVYAAALPGARYSLKNLPYTLIIITNERTMITKLPIKLTAHAGMLWKNVRSWIASVIPSGSEVTAMEPIFATSIVREIIPWTIRKRAIIKSSPYPTTAFAIAKRTKRRKACSGFLISMKFHLRT